MNWHRSFARMMAILGLSLNDIMDLSLAQFLLYSVEASEIEKQQNEKGGGASGAYAAPGGQDFKSRM